MIAAVAALGFLLAPAAQASDATRTADRGFALFDQQRYEEACPLFADAYQLDPDPSYLWAHARCQQLAGNCALSVELYERYISTAEDPDDVATAKQMVGACKGAEGAEREAEAAPTPAPAPPPPAVHGPTPDAGAQRPAIWDPPNIALLTVGVVASVVGGGLLVGGVVHRRAAPEQATDGDDLRQRVRRGNALTIAGATVAGVGVAVLAGAVIRLAILKRRAARGSASNRRDWRAVLGGALSPMRPVGRGARGDFVRVPIGW